MSKLDTIMKWGSLVFLGLCILLSVFLMNNRRLVLASQQIAVLQSNMQLYARSMANLNAQIANPQISQQINGLLINTGFAGLVEQQPVVVPAPVEPDTSAAE